jgi:hypothetical protein
MRGALLASSAIRCCRVNTNSGFEAPVMFPSNGPLTQASPSLLGVPQVWFPQLHGTMGCSDPQSSFPPHFVSFAWRYLALRLSSSLLAARRRQEAWCIWRGRTEPHFMDWETLGLSSSRGTLHADALFSDPGGIETSGHCNAPTRPPLLSTTRAPTTSHFRGSIAGPRRSLSTLRPQELPRVDARLASGRWPALPGELGGSQGPNKRFPSCFLTSLPPFPSFLTQ